MSENTGEDREACRGALHISMSILKHTWSLQRLVTCTLMRIGARGESGFGARDEAPLSRCVRSTGVRALAHTAYQQSGRWRSSQVVAGRVDVDSW